MRPVVLDAKSYSFRDKVEEIAYRNAGFNCLNVSFSKLLLWLTIIVSNQLNTKLDLSSTNPTVVRSGSTLTTSSTSTATSSISGLSTDYDHSETGSIPEVPNRRGRMDSKMERPQSWVAKMFSSRRNEPDSPQQPRRKTIDVAGKRKDNHQILNND